MATAAQIEANRANALKSTGPRTDEGKRKSARNALKHGLAGHGVVMPDETADAIQARKTHWRKGLRPDGPYQEWLFERICIESVRADACLHLEIASRDEMAQRASESWDDDRRLEAEELAGGLSKRPEVVQPKLLQTRQGCDVLIREWEVLGAMLRKDGGWRMPTSWDRALDLLGVPVGSREGRNPGELGPGAGAYEPGLKLVADQVADLRRRQAEYLNERDTRARCDAEAGLVPPDAQALRRLRRYESEGLRRLAWLTRELQKAQRSPSAGPVRPERSATPAEVAPPAREPAVAAALAPAPVQTPAPAAAPRPAANGSAPTEEAASAPKPAMGSGRTLTGLLRDQILASSGGSAARARRN